MDHAALAALIDCPPVDDIPIAAAAIEELPFPATIVEAIRSETGKVTDFRIIYSNAAAGAGSPDRTETYGMPVGDVIPAFQELGLCNHYADVVEGKLPKYTAEGVRLAGEYDGIAYDVIVDLVAVPLGGDYVLSLSHDRTAENALGDRLVAAQEVLRRRHDMDRQLREVHTGLIDDLVQVRRALENDDVREADRHAARGSERAAEIILAIRSLMASGG